MESIDEKNKQSPLYQIPTPNISLNKLFPDSLSKSYSINLSNVPLTDSTIDQLYGPFNNTSGKIPSSTTPPSPNANGNSSFVSSPKLTPQQELALLKEKIAKMEQQNLLRSKSVTPSSLINTPTKIQSAETNNSLIDPSTTTSIKPTVINLKNNINNNDNNNGNNIKNGTLSNTAPKLPTTSIANTSTTQGSKPPPPLNKNNHHLKNINMTPSNINPIQSKDINSNKPTAFSTTSKIESQSKLPLSSALPNSAYNTLNKNNQHGSAHLQTSVFYPALSCAPNITTNSPLSPSSYTSSHSTVQTEINKNHIVAPIPTRYYKKILIFHILI